MISMIIVEKDGLILRQAQLSDMPRIDEVTIICYTPITESWIEMQSESIFNATRNPNVTWEQRKTKQNHDLFAEHPEWIWVLEQNSTIIGFVTFYINFERSIGTIDNNGVLPEYSGRGLGKFMYRYVLDYFRKEGIKVGFVETGLDDPHIPARKAYEGVGFDRSTPVVYYWQDLRKNNPGSTPQDN